MMVKCTHILFCSGPNVDIGFLFRHLSLASFTLSLKPHNSSDRASSEITPAENLEEAMNVSKYLDDLDVVVINYNTDAIIAQMIIHNHKVLTAYH